MSDYDHPPEYDRDDLIAALEDIQGEEDRRVARADIDWWRRQREAEDHHDRDLERDIIDRINEGRP